VTVKLCVCSKYFGGFARDSWEQSKCFVRSLGSKVIGVNDGTNWIDLAQDRDRWRAVVNAVMNLRFP
jgi:hypothetical protein